MDAIVRCDKENSHESQDFFDANGDGLTTSTTQEPRGGSQRDMGLGSLLSASINGWHIKQTLLFWR